MGIEPTSEPWEGGCRWLKTHKLSAFCRFSKFSNWSSGRMTDERAGRVMASAVGIGNSYNRIWSLRTAATRKNTLFRTESAQ